MNCANKTGTLGITMHYFPSLRAGSLGIGGKGAGKKNGTRKSLIRLILLARFAGSRFFVPYPNK